MGAPPMHLGEMCDERCRVGVALVNDGGGGLQQAVVGELREMTRVHGNSASEGPVAGARMSLSCLFRATVHARTPRDPVRDDNFRTPPTNACASGRRLASRAIRTRLSITPRAQREARQFKSLSGLSPVDDERESLAATHAHAHLGRFDHEGAPPGTRLTRDDHPRCRRACPLREPHEINTRRERATRCQRDRALAGHATHVTGCDPTPEQVEHIKRGR